MQLKLERDAAIKRALVAERRGERAEQWESQSVSLQATLSREQEQSTRMASRITQLETELAKARAELGIRDREAAAVLVENKPHLQWALDKRNAEELRKALLAAAA